MSETNSKLMSVSACVRCGHRFLCSFWPSLLTLGVVLWLTLFPDPTPDLEIPSFLGEYADKIVHAIMMGGLTGAFIFDMKRRTPGAPRTLPVRTYCWLAVGMLLFCVADEWAQDAMNLGRSGDVYDLLADAVGIGIALIAAPPVCNRLIGRFTKR